MRYVLLCAFRNRREKTLRFLDAVVCGRQFASATVVPILFDDGSSDGTAEAIRLRHPRTSIIQGDGSYYWNGAMSVLVDQALADPNTDAIILANDDIELDVGALDKALSLFETLNATRPTALVGAFHDRAGNTSYSGLVRTPRRSPLSLSVVEPGPEPRSCDTFNGNFAVIQASHARRIGGIDSRFLHAYGDIDLGYRLAHSGVRLVVAPGHMGVCEKGLTLAERLCGLSLGARTRMVLGPLRSPKDHLIFLLKHARITAPLLIMRDWLRRARLIALGR